MLDIRFVMVSYLGNPDNYEAWQVYLYLPGTKTVVAGLEASKVRITDVNNHEVVCPPDEAEARGPRVKGERGSGGTGEAPGCPLTTAERPGPALGGGAAKKGSKVDCPPNRGPQTITGVFLAI